MTQEQYNNLLVFLQRTELKGSEVEAYIQCQQAITNLYKSQEEKQDN